jgi:ATP-binding cassette subfamily B protein
MSPSPNTPPRSPVQFYLQIARKHRLGLLVVFGLIILIEIAISSGAYVLGVIVDTASVTDLTPEIITTIGWWLLFFVVVLRFGAVLGIRIRSMILHIISKTLRTQSARVLFSYMSGHSSSYYADHFAGSISNDVGTVSESIVQLNSFVGNQLLSVVAQLVTTGVFLYIADPRLLLFFAIGLVILIPLNYLLAKRTKHLAADSITAATKLRGRIVDTITNITLIQQFSRREHESQELDHYIYDYQKKSIRSDIYSEQVLLFNNFMVVLVFISSLIGAAYWFWIQGELSLGAFIMVISLTGTLVKSLTHVGNSMNQAATLYGQIDKALGRIVIPHEVMDEPTATALSVPEGEIICSNVSFTYEQQTPIFSSLSLNIPAGQKVGVVGSSGSGKTTFTRLLLRQYDIDNGSIKIDNQDIQKVTQDSLRSNIAIVAQESQLFHRSIAENISYGRPDASTEEIIAAAQKAQIHEFVTKLKDGYGTLVGERGVKLSGGQRQRIAIARAIIKDAPILILDEATSALDSESEAAIQQALSTLMEDKTVIAIAHRLSTLQQMDRILVFSDGKIIEDGSHHDLLMQNGTYASLWHRQAGGFVTAEGE